MQSLAFFAFLRIGEITVKNSREPPRLCMDQVIVDLGRPQDGLSIIFRDYKHAKGSRPFCLQVPMQRDSDICPVRSMIDYLNARSVLSSSALFVKADGSPISADYFRGHLNNTLKANSLDPTFYKGHSFRIGAASWASEKGFSDDHIRQLGRWKSDAFRKYIRNVSVSA